MCCLSAHATWVIIDAAKLEAGPAIARIFTQQQTSVHAAFCETFDLLFPGQRQHYPALPRRHLPNAQASSVHLVVAGWPQRTTPHCPTDLYQRTIQRLYYASKASEVCQAVVALSKGWCEGRAGQPSAWLSAKADRLRPGCNSMVSFHSVS